MSAVHSNDNSRLLRRSLLVRCFALIALSTLLVFATSARAEVSCEKCGERGYPYVCKVPMTSQTCFTYAGDSHCNSNVGCVCCRTQYAEGCKRCDIAEDVFEDDDDLLDDIDDDDI